MYSPLVHTMLTYEVIRFLSFLFFLENEICITRYVQVYSRYYQIALENLYYKPCIHTELLSHDLEALIIRFEMMYILFHSLIKKQKMLLSTNHLNSTS